MSSDESDSLRSDVAEILRQQGNERGAAIIEDNDRHDRADTIEYLRDELDQANTRADEIEGSADDLADQVRKLTGRNTKLRDGVRSIAARIDKATHISVRDDEFTDLLDEIAADARKLLD